MCGIVGAVAERNIVPVLVEGLRRLEYRGYDSAGLAVLQQDGAIGLCRTVGKVAELEDKLRGKNLRGRLGVAHTRWATHGGVTEANAHPHLSGDRVAVIHNGIIENFQPIKDDLIAKGYEFKSETDTEVAAHLVNDYLKQGLDLVKAVGEAVKQFEGAYALLVFDAEDPGSHRRQPRRQPARYRPRPGRELRCERRAGALARHTALYLSGARRPRRDYARQRQYL